MTDFDLTVVIATYDRPAGLLETLQSCFAQSNRLNLRRELVVLDNHPSQSGLPVVQGCRASNGWTVRHVAELTRNMATLRNRGFAEARSPLLAFIDDDEVADPNWLDELVSALRESGADIAVGPRLAHFASGAAPAYDPTGGQFVRDLKLEDRSLIPLTTPSGKPRYGLGTGNSLFDLPRCFGDGETPMREAFGDAGGEDSELFIRLHRSGKRLVWAARAVVTETVAAHRTTVAYRLVRTLREAQHYCSIYRDGAKRPGLVALELWVKGALQIVVGAVIAAGTLEFRSERRLFGRMLIAHGLGKIKLMRPVGYINEKTTSLGDASGAGTDVASITR